MPSDAPAHRRCTLAVKLVFLSYTYVGIHATEVPQLSILHPPPPIPSYKAMFPGMTLTADHHHPVQVPTERDITHIQ